MRALMPHWKRILLTAVFVSFGYVVELGSLTPMLLLMILVYFFIVVMAWSHSVTRQRSATANTDKVTNAGAHNK